MGSAKELIESTAKVVLTERGRGIDEKVDLPAVVRDAQRALGLHPSATTPGADGSDAVKRILGATSSLAIGVAELRNHGYDRTYVRDTKQVGAGPVLAVTVAEWDAFLARARDGEFDRPTHP